MRVTLVNRALGIYFAGAERFDYEIALALQKRGVEVEMVVGKRLLSAPDHPVPGITTRYLGTPYLRDISQRLDGRLGNQIMRFDQYLFERRCARYLRAHDRPDIIQVCSLPRLVRLQKAMQVPVVVWFPGIPAAKYLPLIREAAAVVSHGDVFQNLRARFRKDAVCVPQGLDLKAFRRRPNNLRQRLGIGTAPVVLYVGRLAPIKNLPLLLQAFALVQDKVPEARLIMVGTGPLYEEIEKQIRRLKLSPAVHLAGFVRDNDDLAAYYSIADVFALSSTYDGDPNVIREAMSCGLPVVATRVGGIPAQMQDGVNGFLVESGDAQALAQRLVDLLTDSRLRARLGETNRKAAARFSWDVGAQRLIELYEDILQKGGKSKQSRFPPSMDRVK
jgi:glycosyltransferase involved in cell wall biosynthesis